jgi:outer membrane protein OmpA-like peptidoglycan-associated protein
MIRTKAFATTILGASLALLAGAAPAAAQDAMYLPETASYCDMFRGLSRVIPGHCAGPDDHALDADLGPSRSIRVHAETGTQATQVNITSPVSPQPAPVAAPAPSTAATGDSYAVATVEQEAPPEDLSIAMRIQFEHDSARLSDEARQVLDRVASVLQDQLMQDKVVEIEGHADASGPDAYNLGLSEERARAVRAYLVEQHGVAAARLPYVGKGESEPFDGSDPYNGANRRVEFRNLTG